MSKWARRIFSWSSVILVLALFCCAAVTCKPDSLLRGSPQRVRPAKSRDMEGHAHKHCGQEKSEIMSQRRIKQRQWWWQWCWWHHHYHLKKVREVRELFDQLRNYQFLLHGNISFSDNTNKYWEYQNPNQISRNVIHDSFLNRIMKFGNVNMLEDITVRRLGKSLYFWLVPNETLQTPVCWDSSHLSVNTS